MIVSLFSPAELQVDQVEYKTSSHGTVGTDVCGRTTWVRSAIRMLIYSLYCAIVVVF